MNAAHTLIFLILFLMLPLVLLLLLLVLLLLVFLLVFLIPLLLVLLLPILIAPPPLSRPPSPHLHLILLYLLKNSILVFARLSFSSICEVSVLSKYCCIFVYRYRQEAGLGQNKTF